MSRLVRVLVLMMLAAVVIVQVAPPAEAATISNLNVRCNKTTARGEVEVPAPYVRAQVALASDLSVVLATDVFEVNRKGKYNLKLNYPRQPEGTLLIVAVGEWDGQQYLRPATMTSDTCHGGSTPPVVTPTPYPTPTQIHWPTEPPQPTPYPTDPPWPTPYPTQPPWPSPTPIQIPTHWNVTTTLTADTCGGASTGATFPVTITPDPWGVLTLQRFDLIYTLAPAGTHSGYVGVALVGDATYTLDLFFTGLTTFTAYEHVTFASIPGCFWMFDWAGQMTY